MFMCCHLVNRTIQTVQFCHNAAIYDGKEATTDKFDLQIRVLEAEATGSRRRAKQ